MLLLLAIVVLAMVVLIAMQVDDWSRDLTTNFASTDATAEDPLLRPLEVPSSPAQVRQAILQFVEAQPRWELGQVPEARENSLALVRKTRWLRFADDVQVTLTPTDEGTRIEATSQSRVGRGDLGQNPRNLIELLQALRERLLP